MSAERDLKDTLYAVLDSLLIKHGLEPDYTKPSGDEKKTESKS
jgi:hypothetical protein